MVLPFASPPVVFGALPSAEALIVGSVSAFWGPLFGPLPGGLLFAATLAPGFVSAGAVGSGFGASLCALRNAITSARSCGLLRPAKVILVPGAKLRGLVSHWLRLSQFQVPPFFDNASEKANPLPCPIGSPITSHRFGPSWLAPPLSALWHAMHLLKTCCPFAGSAFARNTSIGCSAAAPPSPSSCTPAIG